VSDAVDEELERLTTPAQDANVLEGEEFSRPLAVLLSKPALCVDVSATVGEAVHLMREKGYGAVIVTEHGRLAGIFTSRDLIGKLVGVVDGFLEQPVSVAMTPNPLALHKSDSIAHVAHNMQVGGYRHIPVVDEQRRPLSVVSIKDLTRFVLGHFPDEVLNSLPEPYRGSPDVYGG
jgi:CBS domain-containing protein